MYGTHVLPESWAAPERVHQTDTEVLSGPKAWEGVCAFLECYSKVGFESLHNPGMEQFYLFCDEFVVFCGVFQ